MTKQWPVILLASFVLAAAPRTAHADDDEDLEGTLNETVVSGASKSAETASDAPATTVTLTAADMRRYGIRTLAEAIDFLGMGMVTQDPLHSVEIGGRGVLITSDYGNHVLLVVDGHAMNEQWDGTAYFEQGAAIPIELIDHIELVLGAGSVLYGGNAMFGVINVVTKSAASYKGLHLIAEGSLSPSYGLDGTVRSFAPGDLGGSYRLGVGLGHEFKFFGKPAEVTGQLEIYRHSGPSFEFAPQTATNSSGAPYDFGPRALAPGVWGGRTSRGTYNTTVPVAHFRFTFGEVTAMVRAASYRRATPYVNDFNLWANDFDGTNHETDRWLQLDVQWRKRLSERFSYLLRGYGDIYDYHSNAHVTDLDGCGPAATGPCWSTSWGGSRWAGLEAQAVQDWLADGRLTTMLGVDGRIRHVFAGGGYDDAATGETTHSHSDGDLTERTYAAYLQQRWTPTKWLHLNGGARYDHDPRGGNHVSPRAAVTFDTWAGGVLKMIYAEAFRPPTFYEALTTYDGQLANPSLHSETVRSVEASIEQKWGANRILFGVFRTWWRDLIVYSELPTGEWQYQNASKIDNFGYNAQFESHTGDLHYGASLTAAYARRDGDDSLPASPSVFGNARISYDLPGAWPVVGLATQFVGRRLANAVHDSSTQVITMAPTQLQLRLTLSDRLPFHPALSWRISANYATSGKSAYVAGPNTDVSTPDAPPVQLAPVNRFTAFASLQYDFAP